MELRSDLHPLDLPAYCAQPVTAAVETDTIGELPIVVAENTF